MALVLINLVISEHPIQVVMNIKTIPMHINSICLILITIYKFKINSLSILQCSDFFYIVTGSLHIFCSLREK